MANALVERVPLSAIASRMRMHPASVYQCAVRLGIVVNRTARVAYVSAADAERIEAGAEVEAS